MISVEIRMVVFGIGFFPNQPRLTFFVKRDVIDYSDWTSGRNLFKGYLNLVDILTFFIRSKLRPEIELEQVSVGMRSLSWLSKFSMW